MDGRRSGDGDWNVALTRIYLACRFQNMYHFSGHNDLLLVTDHALPKARVLNLRSTNLGSHTK